MSNNDLEMPDAPAQELNGQGLQETTCFGLTKRERACIELRIPESGNEELDALIAKAQRRDMAQTLYSGMLGCHDTDGSWTSDNCYDEAVKQADLLIGELGAED